MSCNPVHREERQDNSRADKEHPAGGVLWVQFGAGVDLVVKIHRGLGSTSPLAKGKGARG